MPPIEAATLEDVPLPPLPRIRYTMGPEELGFGPHQLKRGQWCGPVANELAGEAVYPGRVAEYGFEQQGYKAPEPAAATTPAATPAPAPAAPVSRARAAPAPAADPAP